MIEKTHPDNYETFTRYATRKEPDVFSRDRLRAFTADLPEGMEVVPIDEALYARCLKIPLMRDFCSQFDSAADYRQRGIGFCVLCGGEIACGASSYTVYDGGIEVEIATNRRYRRMGLATACAARLILACLERGLYPSWNAANEELLALAQKLGYRFDSAYPTYAVVRPRSAFFPIRPFLK